MPPGWWLRRIKKFGLPVLLICILWLVLRQNGDSSAPIPGIKPSTAATRPPMPSAAPEMNRWVMMMTHGAEICSSLRSQFPGWNILLVGDYLRPDKSVLCTCMNTPVLMGMMSKLPEELRNAFTEPQLAVLYLLQHGAEAIYYLPYEAVESHKEPPVLFTQDHYTGLMYTNKATLFSAAEYLGCSHRSQASSPPGVYALCEQTVPALQVMASVGHSSVPLWCDTSAPPVTLQQGTFVGSFSGHRALYLQAAFWAMPLWEVVEEADIEVWPMVVQKLLWLTGNHVMIRSDAQSNIGPVGSSHKLQSAQKVLQPWKCPTYTFPACARFLLSMLRGESLISSETYRKFGLWLDILNDYGYHLHLSNVTECDSDPVIYNSITHNGPRFQKYDKSDYMPLSNTEAIQSTITSTCKGHNIPTYSHINFTHPWTQFTKTLLLVTFNNPHYEAIPYLESIYRPFYPYILYCGPGFPDTETFPALKNFRFNFVSYGKTPEGHFPGALNYECTSLAVSFHFAVEGYMVIADDIFLAMYKLERMHGHLAWFAPQKEIRIGDVRKLRECRLGMCDFHPRWNWWEDYQNEVLNALLDLKMRQKSSQLAYRCHWQLVGLNGGELRANRAFSDVYYIPSRIAEDFSSLVGIFRKHNVFLEIAIPTIMTCLENPEDIEGLPGLLLWFSSRETPWEHFVVKDFRLVHYMHPTKWGLLAQERAGYAEFFCTKALPFMHDAYGRIM